MTDAIYQWLYHKMSLRTAGVLVGLGLLISHALGWMGKSALRDWMGNVPRHRGLAIGMMVIATLWAFVYVSAADMGEFYVFRRIALIVIPVASLLMILYVEEFLAARALGCLMLLGAAVVLDAAFLELPVTRLLLVVLAYVWIVLGLFYVGMPYLLRDHLKWATEQESRWKALLIGGMGYGAAVLICALVFWG